MACNLGSLLVRLSRSARLETTAHEILEIAADIQNFVEAWTASGWRDRIPAPDALRRLLFIARYNRARKLQFPSTLDTSCADLERVATLEFAMPPTHRS